MKNLILLKLWVMSLLHTYDANKIIVKHNGGCLKQDWPTLLHGGIVNVYIVYEITNNFKVSSHATLENCLFGAVKLTKPQKLTNMDILIMELDLIDMEFFHTLLEELAEMLWFLE